VTVNWAFECDLDGVKMNHHAIDIQVKGQSVPKLLCGHTDAHRRPTARPVSLQWTCDHFTAAYSIDKIAHLKPNSITLAGFKLVRSLSPTSFEPASVMEVGF